MEEKKFNLIVNGEEKDMTRDEVQQLIIDFEKEVSSAKIWYECYTNQLTKVAELESSLKLIKDLVVKLSK